MSEGREKEKNVKEYNILTKPEEISNDDILDGCV